MKIPNTLTESLQRLKSAKCPEDIFGKEADGLKTQYRNWAKLTHEDLHSDPKDKAIAGEAFKRLQEWHKLALMAVDNGSYGSMKPVFSCVIRTKTNAYSLFGSPLSGDMCDVYDAIDNNNNPVLVKLVRNPANNDLMLTEATNLRKMREMAKDVQSRLLVELIDSVEVPQGKLKLRANIIAPFKGALTLTQLHEKIPNLDVRDAAWIFNRIIDALFVVHQLGFVHGAVTPDHFLVDLATHIGLLIDYSYSVEKGKAVKAISSKWRHFYPPEVLSKKGATGPATDLYMAAKTMIYLLGGDTVKGSVPASVPRPIAGILRACLIDYPAYRISDAFELHRDFNETMKSIYGPRKFRVLSIPNEPREN